MSVPIDTNLILSLVDTLQKTSSNSSYASLRFWFVNDNLKFHLTNSPPTKKNPTLSPTPSPNQTPKRQTDARPTKRKFSRCFSSPELARRSSTPDSLEISTIEIQQETNQEDIPDTKLTPAKTPIENANKPNLDVVNDKSQITQPVLPYVPVTPCSNSTFGTRASNLDPWIVYTPDYIALRSRELSEHLAPLHQHPRCPHPDPVLGRWESSCGLKYNPNLPHYFPANASEAECYICSCCKTHNCVQYHKSISDPNFYNHNTP